MTVVGARVIERVNVPGTGAVMVPVGEVPRARSPTVATLVVLTATTGEMPVTESVMSVTVRAMPVAVSVVPAGMAMMPVGGRVDRVGVEVQSVGVPVVSMSVPRAVRPGRRRGLGMGMGNGEERHQRAERKPRDRIAAAVPVVMPPARLGTTGKDEHGCESEYGPLHVASSIRGGASRRRTAEVRDARSHPAPRHCEPRGAGVKPARGQTGKGSPRANRPSARLHLVADQKTGSRRPMKIREDDVRGAEILALLELHLADVARHSPPESVHALDLEALRAPDVTMWTAWEADDLLGCGALKELNPRHGEIKSMRTAETHLRRGVGAWILEHLIAEARRRSYRRLSLETGSMEAFAPARRLYERFGFEECPPFADYRPDPYSVYMTLRLRGSKKIAGPPEPPARFAVRFGSHERHSPGSW